MEFKELLGVCKNCGYAIYKGDQYVKTNNFTLFCGTGCKEEWFRKKDEMNQDKLNGIRAVIEVLSTYTDKQKLKRIEEILNNNHYDGF
jgi:hypothetical protein